MIAPMFQEEMEFEEDDKEEEKSEKKKRCGCCGGAEKEDEKEEPKPPASACAQFLSFSNTIAFVAPYMSALTVAECFMLISTEFVAKGGAYGTVVSQSLAMLALLCFSVSWAFRDLNAFGLTQNEPVFPFGVSMLKLFAFVCGFVGCLLEMLRANRVIDVALELVLLAALVAALALVFGALFLKYHAFFNPLDDDLDDSLLVRFNLQVGASQRSLKVLDLSPGQDKSRPLLLAEKQGQMNETTNHNSAQYRTDALSDE